MSRTFIGTVSEYHAVHNWVRRQLGRPQECENCIVGVGTRFEWANLSGEYKRDISDWARLCTMCHKLIDWKPFCRRGHPYTQGSIYITSSGAPTCYVCKKINNKEYLRKWRARKKLEAQNV